MSLALTTPRPRPSGLQPSTSSTQVTTCPRTLVALAYEATRSAPHPSSSPLPPPLPAFPQQPGLTSLHPHPHTRPLPLRLLPLALHDFHMLPAPPCSRWPRTNFHERSFTCPTITTNLTTIPTTTVTKSHHRPVPVPPLPAHHQARQQHQQHNAHTYSTLSHQKS
jgi:hypothetical protein